MRLMTEINESTSVGHCPNMRGHVKQDLWKETMVRIGDRIDNSILRLGYFGPLQGHLARQVL